MGRGEICECVCVCVCAGRGGEMANVSDGTGVGTPPMQGCFKKRAQ